MREQATRGLNQPRIGRIRVCGEKVRKTRKMENKRSHDAPSLKQLT